MEYVGYIDLYKEFYDERNHKWRKKAFKEIEEVVYGKDGKGEYYLKAKVQGGKLRKNKLSMYREDVIILSNINSKELGVSAREI